MFDPLNQNGDDEIDFSEKNLFEGLPVDEICKKYSRFPGGGIQKTRKRRRRRKKDTR